MSILLIFPPTIKPSSFYLSVPLLLGQLKYNGFDAIGLDLNAEFYNDILNKEYLAKTQEILNLIVKDNEYQNKEKQQIIKDYIANTNSIDKLTKYIEEAVYIQKSKKHYYNPKMLAKSNYIINKALEFICMPYYPHKIYFNHLSYDIKLNYDEIKDYTFNKDRNIFIDYFNQKIDNKIDKNTDLICISVPYDNNIPYALTLSRLLKEKTNAHIALGGSAFTFNEEILFKYSEIFDLYCDSILLGYGENSIVELTKHIKGEIEKENVSGLVYKNAIGKVIKNPINTISTMSDAPLLFDDLDFKQYFTPEIIIPLSISKGCPWGKCSFCGYTYKKPVYSIRKAEKVVDEIESIVKKYNTRYFLFCDDTIPPDYYEKLADEILKRKLKIKYSSYIRLDSKLTKNLLKKLHKSGLMHASWGLESGSQRILDLMNKGINIKDAEIILKNSHDTGIWNHIFFIVGFPTENEFDIEQTRNFCRKNKKYINSFLISDFQLLKNAVLYNKQEEFGIKAIELEDFCCEIKYEEIGITQETKYNNIKSLQSIFYNNAAPTIDLLYDVVSSDALYFLKHGKKWILNKKRK